MGLREYFLFEGVRSVFDRVSNDVVIEVASNLDLGQKKDDRDLQQTAVENHFATVGIPKALKSLSDDTLFNLCSEVSILFLSYLSFSCYSSFSIVFFLFGKKKKKKLFSLLIAS